MVVVILLEQVAPMESMVVPDTSNANADPGTSGANVAGAKGAAHVWSSGAEYQERRVRTFCPRSPVAGADKTPKEAIGAQCW